jgi:hypothetical protein
VADTSYSVDIRTESASVPAAAASLDKLAGALSTAGAGASSLSQQVASAKVALEAAAAASDAAAAAASAGAASYAANEVAAERAAKAADRLGQQVAAAKAKLEASAGTGGYDAAAASLERLEAKHATASARASELTAALAQEGAALDALRASAAGAAEAHEQAGASVGDLEGKLEETTKATEKAEQAAAGSGAVNELGEAFGKLGGPLGAAGQKLFGLADGLKKMGGAAGSGAGAVLGLSVVVIALAAAMAIAVVKTAMWAVGLADASRSASLTTEALSRTSKSLADIGSIMPRVADATGLATDDLQDLAKQLDKAGVSAADMPAALEATAMAEAALGKGGAADLVEDLKAGKKTAAELAREMKSKFGDIVAKKLLSLDSTAAKLKSNLSETFGGLKIEGLLGGLSKMVGLLDQNTASGRAVKFLFETMFQPLIDGAVAALPAIERVMLGMAIGALKMYIALKPTIKAIGEMVGALDEGDGSIDWLKTGESIMYGLAVAVGVVAVAVAAAAAPFYALYAAAMDIWSALQAIDFSAVGEAITSAVSGIDLSTMGTNIIAGLVGGLLGGVPGVIAAMGSLGDAAISALKAKLSIASPSKVFEGLGGFTAEGFQHGVEDGSADAQGAVEDMVGVPKGASRAASGSARGASGVSLEGVNFNFYGVKDAQQAEGMLRDALVNLLSGGLTPAPVG